MNRICWWLVDVASRALAPHERDAVRGDFAESGESAGFALRGVLGLVVRRQAALWKDWRPWAVLTALIIPLAMLLSVMSRITATQSATYTWLYANNWDWALLRYREFWYELRDSIVFLFIRCLPLVCWSWTAGLVLGGVSRRLVPTNGALFCLALLLGELFAAPSYLASWLRYVRPPDQNDPVSALGFYKLVFPLLVLAILVVIPSLWGMRRGRDVGRLRPLLRTAIWIAAIVALSVLVIQEPGVGFFLAAYRHPEIWQSWQIRVVQFVVYWPAAYLISNAIGRRWHRIQV
ncbi:MAG TPA: hypothetical protein VK335_10705 [Bryobacteraceae bacterium]|nr:hypothetical protein [Bryobacteraceae bacterium]